MARGLKDKIVSIPLDAGLGAGSEPKILSATPIKLENCEFNRGGAIEKRSGRNRSDAADNTMINMYPHVDGSVLTGEGKIRKYSTGVGWSDVVPHRAVCPSGSSVSKMVSDTRRTQCLDYAVASDFRAVATIGLDDNGHQNFKLSAFNLNTDERLYVYDVGLGVTSSFSTSVRLLAIDDRVFLYFCDASSNLQCHYFDSSGVVGTEAVAGTSTPDALVSSDYFDACVVNNSGSEYVVLFYKDSGAGDVLAKFLPGGLSSGAPAEQTIYSGSVSTAMVACFAQSDTTVQFVYQYGAGTPYYLVTCVWDLSPAQVASAGQLTSYNIGTYEQDYPLAISGHEKSYRTSLTADYFSTVAVSFQKPTEASKTDQGRAFTNVYITSGAGPGNVITPGATKVMYGLMLAAKLSSYESDNDVAFPMFHRSWDTSIGQTSFDSIYLLMFTQSYSTSATFNVFAKLGYTKALLPSGSDDYFTGFSEILGLPGCALRSCGNLDVPYITQTMGKFGGGALSIWDHYKTMRSSTQSYTVSIGSIDTKSSDLQHALHGGVLYIAGSVPIVVDGEGVLEHGFHCPPDAMYLTLAAGGFLDFDTTYYYCGTYERVDRAGNRYQSPATPFGVSLATDSSNNNMIVKIPGLPVTIGGESGSAFRDGYSSDAVGVYWRGTAGGARYRAGIASDNSTGTIEQLDAVSVYDLSTQSIIEARESVYVDVGILDATVPPQCMATTIWDSRHFCADADNPTSIIRYSRKKYPSVAFEHNETLIVEVPDRGGDIVALSDMLDKLLVLKERAIYTIEGEGKSDGGHGAGYSEPYLVSKSVGCSIRRSVVSIPQGVAFVAQDGSIWLVNQSMGLKNIGDAVRYYTDTYTVVRGISIPDKNLAVWFTSDGPAIVYNWLRDKWCTWTNHDAVDAAVVGSDLYWLDSDGYVWSEDTASYDDNNTYVPMKVETGWINVPQIGGCGRVREIALIGYFRQDCQLRIRAAYNGDPAWDDNLTYDLDTLEPFDYTDYYGAGLTLGTYTDQAMVLKVYTSRRRMTSLRLSISDEQSDGGPASSKGFSLVAAALRVAAKPGSHRVGTTRKIGN